MDEGVVMILSGGHSYGANHRNAQPWRLALAKRHDWNSSRGYTSGRQGSWTINVTDEQGSWTGPFVEDQAGEMVEYFEQLLSALDSSCDMLPAEALDRIDLDDVQRGIDVAFPAAVSV